MSDSDHFPADHASIRRDSDILWTAAESEAATGGTSSHPFAATGVAIDTRDLVPGDLFVALKGARDGHDFVPEAFAKGASAALVVRRIEGGSCLLVDDTQAALERLGAAARDRARAFRIGVTGSVGKTSVKELVASILHASGPAHHSVKSYNNHWGVPLTLARMPAATQRAVFELGMSAAGEIRVLGAQIRPHCAIVTRIAPAHLEFFDGIAGIAAAKAEIFEALAPEGIALVPGSDVDEFGDFLAGKAAAHGAAGKWRFGMSSGAEGRLLSFATIGPGESAGEADILGTRVHFRLPIEGTHWGVNAVIALLAGAAAGIPAKEGAEALSTHFRPPEGRGARFELQSPSGKNFTLIDDSYNANPVSMAAALVGLSQHPGRKIAALGEMRELGPAAGSLHSGLAAGLTDIDLVFLAGGSVWDDLWASLSPVKRGARAGNAAALIPAIETKLESGDHLLVKGSNASGMRSIVTHFRTPSYRGGSGE